MLVKEDLKLNVDKTDELKRQMYEEFEQFQQYLRTEKKTFGELYTKVRQLEKDAGNIKQEMNNPGSVDVFSDQNLSPPSANDRRGSMLTTLSMGMKLKVNQSVAIARPKDQGIAQIHDQIPQVQ